MTIRHGPTLIFSVADSFYIGGFADRITGMAALRKIAESFRADFKIEHSKPFDFFRVFPDRREVSNFFDTTLTTDYKIEEFNLIDDHFLKNIDSLINFLLSNHLGARLARVCINNVKPFVFDPLLNQTFLVGQGDRQYIERIERDLLYKFGQDFLRPDISQFNENVIRLAQALKLRPAIGVQVRVGGQQTDWNDQLFSVPSIDQILSELTNLQHSFDAVYVSTDDYELKLKLIQNVQRKWPVYALDGAAVHLERSQGNHDDLVSQSIGDHTLLRLCSAGVLVGDGGYGRTASILAGTPCYQILKQ